MKAMKVLAKINVQSATFRTCLMPTQASFTEKAKEASQKYNEMVQAAGKNHEYGPPHVHVWAALAAEA